MKNRFSPPSAAALALLLCACATTSVKQTWKSPDCPPGPVKKVAVIVVADQKMVRPGLENRFSQDIAQQGQPAITTVPLLSLAEIKEDKEAAKKRLQAEGVDSILIVRLADKSSSGRQARPSTTYVVPVYAGYGYGWSGYYDVVFMDMRADHSSLTDYLVIESSLFNLNSGERLWSILTESKIKEGMDRLVVADELAAQVAAALRKDGLIR